MNFSFNLDLDDELEDELNEDIIDLDKIKCNLHSYSQERICEIITCNRYFNINSDLTVFCMEELSLRRSNGSDFDFESYIDSLRKELPIIDTVVPDIRNMLSQIIGKVK